MEELNILVMLLQHANDQINGSVTVAMGLIGIVATFTMSQSFATRYNWILKLLMSIAMTVLLFYNRGQIIEQMEIYNAVLLQIGDTPLTSIQTLFANEYSVYTAMSTTTMWFVHGVASWFLHLLIWHIELKEVVWSRIQTWWESRK
jgi:hypothetical protein